MPFNKKMPLDNITKAAAKYLQANHKAHTVIVYGSRARGDATPDSDIDIACFTDAPSVATETGTFQNCALDVWIYPTTAMNNITDEFLKLNDSICIVDDRGLGATLLSQVKIKIAAGPPLLNPDEEAHLVQWIEKMLNRSVHNDVEGNYRRTWLQYSLLKSYFDLRGRWYFGPKQSLSWLQENDETAFELFSQAYKSPQNIDALRLLATYIVHP